MHGLITPHFEAPSTAGATIPPAQPAEPGAVVRVRSLAKRFRREDGSVVPAVDHVSLDVQPGEFVVLLGPSGCGKTTLLRCIAGLEKPDAGRVELHGKAVYDSDERTNLPPERRSISMVFQSYALWPHMSAFDNVAYPLQCRGVPREQLGPRVKQALALLGIPELVGQFPTQMSGGQQQRVALARAIVANDNLVLFDEPLSNVDAKVRESLRIELLEMQRRLGFSAVYVTHDQTEAMALAHRVAVMQRGKIVQLASPREVYERPATRYVADFIGTSNQLQGRVLSGDNTAVRVETDLGEVAADPAAAFKPGDAVAIVFRPEKCRLSQTAPDTGIRWQGDVAAALFLGSHTEHVVMIGGHSLRVWGGSRLFEIGSKVWISVAPEDLRAVTD